MLLLLVIFFLIQKTCTENKKNVQTIRAANKYSYVVGVGFNDSESRIDKHVCSGCLIEINWVITAGKCTDLKRNYFVSVPQYKNGTVFLTKFSVLKSFVYARDNNNGALFGVMRIQNIPFDYELPTLPVDDYINRVDLPVAFVQFDAESKLSSSKVFNVVTSVCPEGIENVVCVGDEKDIIYSFGGPLMYEDVIIGVYSGYLEEDRKEFVPVSSFLNWIGERIEIYQNMG